MPENLQSARVRRRRLQAGAFSRHPRRGAAGRLLRGPRRELHGRRRAAARAARGVARTLCAVGAWRRAVDRLDAAARPRPSRAAARRCATAISRRVFPSIWPGRRTTASISTTSCRCPIRRQTLARVVEHVDEVQTALGRQMLLENPSTYVAFAESTIPEIDFLAEMSRANRMRTAARHQQRLRIGDQPRHRSRWPISTRFRFDRVKEIHLGGHHEETDDAGAPLLIDSHGSPVADRGLGALCARHRPHRADADPDRMGQ